jgi:hypothetical protein
MILRRLIASLLAVLVIAGLVVAPLVTPAAAKVMAGAELTDMASMSGNMPCCPDEKSTGCPDCPLAAMCVFASVLAGPSSAEALPMRLPTRAAHSVFDDAPSHGLDRPPPDHPPRILV